MFHETLVPSKATISEDVLPCVTVSSPLANARGSVLGFFPVQPQNRDREEADPLVDEPVAITFLITHINFELSLGALDLPFLVTHA